MTHSQNCGNDCIHRQYHVMGLLRCELTGELVQAKDPQYQLMCKVGCASWSDGQPQTLEQRLEQKALIDGGTRGLGDYLILKEMNNADKRTERTKVLDKLHEWFNNYCEGNEEPDLWMAFIKAERALRSSKDGEP
jgi:hypothetical protein